VIPTDTRHHLCIADVVNKNIEYEMFYAKRRSRGDWITLDVGAFENMDTTVEELWLATDKVRPQEVVLPDKFLDSAETCIRSAQGYEALEDPALPAAQFMVVPQGKDYTEWLSCLRTLVSDVGPRVHTVGIIEEVLELYGRSRMEVAADVYARTQDVDVHLLGFMTDFSDVSLGRRVRSCDTGKFVCWGYNAMLVMRDGPWPDTYPGRDTMGGRQNFFEADCIDPFMIETMLVNVQEWSGEI
jgi:hypothetical protein